MTQEQFKNSDDCLSLFKQLPRLNHRYEVKEKGVFIPTLYWLNEKWYISWDDEEGRTLDIYWASTVDEVIKQAFDNCQAKVSARQKANKKEYEI